MTLEQARVLEAVARLGTIQKAALELHRGHSAILYSLKSLEEQTQLALFDRTGHRNRLSLEGEIVLKYCRRILATKDELADTCQKIKGGWEPSLKLIYDEVIDFNDIGEALFQLNKMRPPTEIKILSAHLNEVESIFGQERADMMVTILPFQKLQIPSRALRPIHMLLVAHKEHALSQKKKKILSAEDLTQQTFITIKNSSNPIGLSTEGIRFDSYFFVTNFATKKLAIMNKLGFGWVPDYLIQDELRKGTILHLKTDFENKISVFPKLYHRAEESLGKAAKELLHFLTRK